MATPIPSRIVVVSADLIGSDKRPMTYVIGRLRGLTGSRLQFDHNRGHAPVIRDETAKHEDRRDKRSYRREYPVRVRDTPSQPLG